MFLLETTSATFNACLTVRSTVLLSFFAEKLNKTELVVTSNVPLEVNVSAEIMSVTPFARASVNLKPGLATLTLILALSGNIAVPVTINLL